MTVIVIHNSLKTDEQFNDWVREVVDDDFKNHSNFTEDFSIHRRTMSIHLVVSVDEKYDR